MTIAGEWAAPLINHLWQSTVFAAVVWLLAQTLRKNRARTRYWLWLLASIKFLVPFSILIDAGGYLSSKITVPTTKADLPVVMQQITQPFSQQGFTAELGQTYTAPEVMAHHVSVWPYILIGAWLWGSLFLVFSWSRRWLQLRRLVRTAIPMGFASGVPVLSSRSTLEPGILGIFKPVLLLPEGITDRLTADQFNAIIAHEMCHVRSCDNLTAAIQMFVETLFWFHPLVWWIRARLIEERERACDEAVLEQSNDAEVYAQGILNVCKFYTESPLTCASGVTGSDLKKRIVRIMTEQVVSKLDLGRKLLLSIAGVIAFAVPITFGLLRATESRAQSASVKASEPIIGTWQGTLQTPNKALRAVLKVEQVDGGGLKATFYSLDQGGQPIQATKTALEGATLKFSIEMLDVTYEGSLSTDHNSVVGTFKQNDRVTPLNLVRATPETAWTIPEPQPKLPPMAADAKPEFEVATIKPSKPDAQGKGFRERGRRVLTMNTSLRDLITFAYGLHAHQVAGGPEWLGAQHFDISGQPDVDGVPNIMQMKILFQKLMADRFQLKFHYEKRDLPVYALVVAKAGAKIKKSDADPSGLPNLVFTKLGTMPVQNATLGDFAGVMQEAVMDRPVIDQTGLTGKYDFILKWTPDESQFSGLGVKVPKPTESDDAPPPLFTAIQEQLGLKLDATKALVDVLVIDHVEKPSEN
jgi:uncharacterized protein (TIGR03435 family)